MSVGAAGVSIASIREAAARLDGHILRTPLHRLPAAAFTDAPHLADLSIHLKMENLQLTGSFKARGATNAVRALTDAQAARGVACHSAGNHGAALAWAASQRGIPCAVVVPRTAPRAKVAAIAALGARIVETEHAERAAAVEALVAETGATVVHPFDDDAVISGQGTVGLEIAQQVVAPTDALDAVLVPISGGGLAAGIAVALEELSPTTRIVLVEPRGKRLAERFAQKTRGADAPDAATPIATVADGMRSRPLGERPWAILLAGERNAAVLSVDDDAVLDAMTHIFQVVKAVVEPSGATALAAILATPPDELRRAIGEDARHVGVVCCGGNLDMGPILRGHYYLGSS